MSPTLGTTLFAVLMAGAIVAMLTILVGFVSDRATAAGRDGRAWLARFRPFCLAVQRSQTSTNFGRSATANGRGGGGASLQQQAQCACSEKTLGRQVTF